MRPIENFPREFDPIFCVSHFGPRACKARLTVTLICAYCKHISMVDSKKKIAYTDAIGSAMLLLLF